MNITRTALLLTFATATLAGPLASSSAFAAQGITAQPYNIEQVFVADMQKMADRNGMVSKKDFMKTMSKKFDAMDKGHHGMLTPAQLERIFSTTTGQ